MNLSDQLLNYKPEEEINSSAVLVPTQKPEVETSLVQKHKQVKDPPILEQLQPTVLAAILLLDQWKTESGHLASLIEQGHKHLWPEKTHRACQRFEACLKQDLRRIEEAVGLMEKDFAIASMGKNASPKNLRIKLEDLKQKMANFQHKYLDLKNELLEELVREHPITFF